MLFLTVTGVLPDATRILFTSPMAALGMGSAKNSLMNVQTDMSFGICGQC